jgi:hypothetical protein
LLSFAFFYFFESRLFNGLHAIQARKIPWPFASPPPLGLGP